MVVRADGGQHHAGRAGHRSHGGRVLKIRDHDLGGMAAGRDDLDPDRLQSFP